MKRTKTKPKYPAVAVTSIELKREARQLTRLLKGKRVLKVWRHRKKEIAIQFTDESCLFVDSEPKGIETSVT